MYIEIIAVALSIIFAGVIYYYANNFRERIIDVQKELEIIKGRYFYIMQVVRDKKKLTRDRIREICEYDDKIK